MKACGTCGQELEDAARFCIRCGSAVAIAEGTRDSGQPSSGIPQAEEMNVTILSEAA